MSGPQADRVAPLRRSGRPGRDLQQLSENSSCRYWIGFAIPVAVGRQELAVAASRCAAFPLPSRQFASDPQSASGKHYITSRAGLAPEAARSTVQTASSGKPQIEELRWLMLLVLLT